MVFIPINKVTIPEEEVIVANGIYTIDYSIEELLTQYNNGKMCCVYLINPFFAQNQVYWTILSDCESGENEGSLYFYGGIANDYS
jgi:hypothetical protein